MLTKVAATDEASTVTSNATLRYLLGAIRSHLGMDVAFIAEFVRGQRVFRLIDADEPGTPIEVGDAMPLESTYCQRVVDGRLPPLIHDASHIAEARALPATRAFPIGAHISAPIMLDDGKLFGTICCFSREPDTRLRERELSMLRLVSEFAGKEISRDINAIRGNERKRDRIQTILDTDGVDLVYQPIYHLKQQRTVGFETLARFKCEQFRSPDICFAEAAEVGLDEALEMKVVSMAVRDLQRFPADIYITINTSPQHILSGAVGRALKGVPEGRVVVEVTEHAYVADYARLRSALARLRDSGVDFAVDDAGAGYSSFRHILELEPDIIKLDLRLTRNIHRDERRRSLATGLISFALSGGSRIVAEGVETVEELQTLRTLGVSKVQGFHVGRPVPVEDMHRYLGGFTI